MADRAAGIWPTVRGLLIALTIGVQWLDAMPLPEVKARDLRHPLAQEELEDWAAWLTEHGYPITKATLAEHCLTVGQGASTFRKAALRPWFPFRRLTGTGQAWGLFAYPSTHAGRLVIAGREGTQAWRDLYRSPDLMTGSPLAATFEYRRVRGVYDDSGDRPNPSNLYDRFTAWAARRAFDAFPSVDEVEVRLDMVRITLPGEGAPVADTRRQARTHLRQPVRRDDAR